MTNGLRDFFDGLSQRYLGRQRRPEDGVAPERIEAAEARLGIRLPAALRELYLRIGANDELLRTANSVRPPEELDIEHGYLVWMDENQDVVTWGVRPDDPGDDPEAFQRVNSSPPEWHSEEQSLTALLASMFDYYRGIDR